MKDPQFNFPNLSVLTFSTTHPEDFQLSPENVFILVILRPNQVIFLCCRDWKSSVLEGMENLHFYKWIRCHFVVLHSLFTAVVEGQY